LTLMLDQLTADVVARAPSDEPLAQLAAAVAVAEDVRDVADALLDRFVTRARSQGRSWSEIGGVLGVSKQAAQQRYVAVPRKDLAGVMAAAERHARALRHHYVGTEHVLLALVADEGLAGAALARLGIDAELVTRQIMAIVGLGEASGAGALGVTPRTKRVFDAARQEALRLGYRCAAPEHVLLALGRDRGGVGARVLRDCGATDDRVREQLGELAPELGERLAAGARRRRLRRR
jgi:hypothetical protein